jgi:hypothetical protein
MRLNNGSIAALYDTARIFAGARLPANLRRRPSGGSLMPTGNSLFAQFISLFRRKCSLLAALGNSIEKAKNDSGLEQRITRTTLGIAKIPCIFPGNQGIGSGE